VAFAIKNHVLYSKLKSLQQGLKTPYFDVRFTEVSLSVMVPNSPLNSGNMKLYAKQYTTFIQFLLQFISFVYSTCS
jgi:hypothetical protein